MSEGIYLIFTILIASSCLATAINHAQANPDDNNVDSGGLFMRRSKLGVPFLHRNIYSHFTTFLSRRYNALGWTVCPLRHLWEETPVPGWWWYPWWTVWTRLLLSVWVFSIISFIDHVNCLSFPCFLSWGSRTDHNAFKASHFQSPKHPGKPHFIFRPGA